VSIVHIPGAASVAGPTASSGGPVRPGGGLSVRDLVVRYEDGDAGPTTAVAGVSFDVAPGEVLALLGPSGCGKSSLLRAIAGLEPVAAGSVSWDGADLAALPVHRRGFGLMFQEGQLFPHRDVARNVGFGLEMARVPRAERARRVDALLHAVGLDGYRRRAVSTLSGGEQQRVALARALAPAPSLLLLDEPLSALDRSLRERLAGDVRRTLVETGTTALFVTHDHDEAFTVADRVAVMSGGHLLRVDAPARLWREPGSRRVAEFLGYEAFVPLDARGPVAAAVRQALADAASVGRVGEAGRDPVIGEGLGVSDDGARGESGDSRAARSSGDGGGVLSGRASGHLAALAPGALVVHRLAGGSAPGAAPVTGVARGATFRRGRSEVAVDVAGLGTVTAVAPGMPAFRPGESVELRVDPAFVAVVPGT
jgi:thiamine transport system ATP-binding protein